MAFWVAGAKGASFCGLPSLRGPGCWRQGRSHHVLQSRSGADVGQTLPAPPGPQLCSIHRKDPLSVFAIPQKGSLRSCLPGTGEGTTKHNALFQACKTALYSCAPFVEPKGLQVVVMNSIGCSGAELQRDVYSYLVSEPCPGGMLGPWESEGSATRPLWPKQNSHLPALPQETAAPELLKKLKHQQESPQETRFTDATLHVLGESRDRALCSAPTGAAQGLPSAAPAAFPTVPRRARPGAIS